MPLQRTAAVMEFLVISDQINFRSGYTLYCTYEIKMFITVVFYLKTMIRIS